MKYLIQLICLILIQAVCLYAEDSNDAVKIGVVMGLTGDASFQAAAVKEGIDLALEELKAEGKKIDVAWEDDQTNPTKSVSSVRSLSSRGYKYLIGPLWSFQLKAVSPILLKEHLISIVPGSASDINGGPSSSVFNLCPPRSNQLDTLRAWFKENPPQKTLLLTPKGDWGEIHRTVVIDAVQTSGGEILAAEEFNYPLDPVLARSLVLKYKSKGIDTFFTTGGPSDVAHATKIFLSLKIQPKILSTQDLSDAVTLGLVKENEITKDSYVVRLAMEPGFAEVYKKKHGKDPYLYADRGYLATKMLAHAASSKKLNAKDVAANLISTGQFDSNGDNIKGQYEIVRIF